MSITYHKSFSHALIILACALLVAGGAAFAFAQTTDLPEGVTQEQIDGALEDLSALYGSPVVRTDQAKAICNQEEYFLACAEIGQEHELFDDARAEQVDTLVDELKGDVVAKMTQCTDVECLIGVATALAQQLSKSNPAAARAVDLTSQKIDEKSAILATAKEIGVDFDECRTMDPDTASIELLRACARLAKDSRMQQHIPEAARDHAAQTDATISLKENLASGEVQCGDGTLEGCGNFCLNPSAEIRAQGTAVIPPICRQIAERFFGSEGVKELESSYTQVQQTREAASRSQEVVFTTLDGRTLANPQEIGRYMEAAGQRGDVEAVKLGMDFMVARGFVRSADRDFALKMVERIRDRGAINFDDCRTNPEACRDFVPEDHQSGFAAMGQVERIMRTAMTNLGVSDPSRCEFDHSIGQACMDGARAALPQIRALAGQYPELNTMIADLEQKIRFGEEAFTARGRAEEHMRTGAFTVGDRQFTSMSELEAFCREQSQACLAEAARTGFVGRDVAAERYEYTAQRQYEHYNPDQRFTSVYQPTDFANQNQNQTTTFDKDAARKAFETWLENPQGPAPYQTGPGYNDPYRPYPMPYPYPGDYADRGSMPYYPNRCPIIDPRPCPMGEYRQESRNAYGCSAYGACIPISTNTQRETSVDGRVICPSLPTIDSCPAGEEKVVSFSSPECGTYYTCYQKRTNETQINFPYTFRSGKVTPSYEAARMYCYESGQYGATTRGDVGECGSTFGFSVPPMPPEKQCGQYGFNWYPVDSSGNCFSPDKTQYRTPNGTLQQCSTTPVYGCDQTTQPPVYPSGQKQQTWNSYGLQSSIRNDASDTRIASLKAACANVKSSSANIWMPGGGDYTSNDFGMPDPNKCAKAAACTSGQYFDGASCVSGVPVPTTCPSGQYWSGTSCVTSDTWPTTGGGMQKCFYPNATKDGRSPGYTIWCEKDYYNCHEGSPSGATISLTGLSLGAPSTCESGWTNNTSSCPSGQYWDGTKCGTGQDGCTKAGGMWDTATNYCKMPVTSTTCPAGQYWGGSSCVSSSPTATCSSYTSQSSCTTAPSGCSWSSTSNYCYYTSTTTTCPSGQYWNGTSCSTTAVSGSCSDTLIGLLGTGCHNMSSAWFNTDMTKYVMPNTTVVKYCASTWVDGCSGGTTTTGSCPSYTSQSTCTAVAGACSWNATSNYCSYSSTTTTCPSGQYWNGSACSSSTTSCSSNTSQSACTSSPGCSWSTSSNYCYYATSCSVATSQSACNGTSGCYWSSSSNSCRSDSSPTTTTCPSGQYWDSTSNSCKNSGTACTAAGGTWNSATNYCAMPVTSGTSCGTYTSMSTCAANSACRWDSANYCTSNTTSSTSCPSGQYWTGTSCSYSAVSSCSSNTSQSTCVASSGCAWSATSNLCYYSTTSCTSSQYWNGQTCVSNTTTTDPQQGCTSAGGTWNSTTSYCQMPGSTSSTSCGTGMYWNGTSCVSNTTTTTTTTCPSGQYWGGSSCVTSTTTTTCPSDQYWNGSSCVSNTTTTTSGGSTSGGTTDYSSMQSGCTSAGGTWDSATHYCQMPSTTSSGSTGGSSSCGTGMYWNGSACVATTSYFCPQGHSWNGSHCTFVQAPTQEKFTASVFRAFMSLFGIHI